MPKQIQQRIIFEMMLRVPKETPTVPVAEGIDIEALTKPDTREGREPFFVTLPLGEKDQTSHNGRYYIGDVAINAIHRAITQDKIGGNKGHTPNAERGTYFDVPVLHWVGALIQDGIVWGKAYVPGDSERMREMRGYYDRLKATKARAGTSLEGLGIQTWNPDTEMWDISELDVLRIDAVEALGVGVDLAGAIAPHITKELKEAVQPGDLAVGDFVSWEENGALMRGQVNTIWTDGEVEVPYSDSPALQASEDNPIARMDVFRPSWDSGEWVNSDYQVVRYFSQITKIERLPELNKKPSMSEAEEGDENLTEEKTQKGEKPMGDKPGESTPKPEDRIAELTQQHEQEVTTLTGQLQEANRELRPLKATVSTLREALSLAEDADIVEAVRKVLGERDSLAGENTDLLESAIQAEVTTAMPIIGEGLASTDKPHVVTFAGTVQGMVSEMVKAASIAKKADIAPAIKAVGEDARVKSMLESLKVLVMGPNVETPLGEANNRQDKPENAQVLIPGVI